MIINIKVSVKKLLKEKYNIDPEVTEKMFDSGILKEHNCRDMLVIEDYKRLVKPKEKQRVKNKLAEKYCISVESIRKIVEQSVQI